MGMGWGRCSNCNLTKTPHGFSQVDSRTVLDVYSCYTSLLDICPWPSTNIAPLPNHFSWRLYDFTKDFPILYLTSFRKPLLPLASWTFKNTMSTLSLGLDFCKTCALGLEAFKAPLGVRDTQGATPGPRSSVLAMARWPNLSVGQYLPAILLKFWCTCVVSW